MYLKKPQVLYIVLSLLVIVLQGQIWLGHHSVPHILHLGKERAALLSENQQLSTRNQALYEEILALKNSGQAIEGRARYDLGMIKKGETYYQFRQSSATPMVVNETKGEVNAHFDHQ